MEPICAWRVQDGWCWSHHSCAQLSLNLDQLGQLPELLAQHDAQLACAVLPYDAGLSLHELSQASAPVQVLLLDKLQRGTQLPASSEDFTLTRPFQAQSSRADYAQAFARVQAYLAAGDCYQINLAQAFSAEFSGSCYAAWRRLMQQHAAPHACYVACEPLTVMSASPERFLTIEAGKIVTDPIKGSRPRGATQTEDDRLAQDLLSSSKDRAENLMIVDLLRNDLGAICQSGSVKAAPLFELQRFSNVQHLVSRISGQLQDDISPMDALLACFPGGSITGAPKKRAMEIIDELEPLPRGAYCGSFFTLDRQGRLDANILIRTFQAQANTLTIHGGGGITVASDVDAEFEECLFKVAKLMQALG